MPGRKVSISVPETLYEKILARREGRGISRTFCYLIEKLFTLEEMIEHNRNQK